MHSESTKKRILQIKQELVRTQVLYQRSKKQPALLATALRQLNAPQKHIAFAENRDRQYHENAFKLIRSALLLRLAMQTHTQEDYEKAFEEILSAHV